MKQDNDKQEAIEVDPQVSAHYEKLADEKTPANLDRAVVREAARAVRADNRMGSFGAWFRPVAFMAMVGLSLTIILDLSDTSIFSPPADMSFEITPPAPVKAPAGPATEAAGSNRPQMTPLEVMRKKKSVSGQSLKMDAPAVCNDEQKSTAEEWWECIETLRQSGLAEAADRELEILRENFPDFEAPE
jgi:hypothetical protein